MANFSLLTYADDGVALPGLLIDGFVFDLAKVLGAANADAGTPAFGSLWEVLSRWSEADAVLDAVVRRVESSGVPSPVGAVSDVPLLTPLPTLRTVYCAAANFTDHMQEMSGRTPPDKETTRPYFFAKSSGQCVIGPDEDIWTSPTSGQLDWEAEIAVIIGKPAYNVSRDVAMDYVAGYAIMNDLTLRDQAKRGDWNFGNDWFRSKSFDRSVVLGPWITPAKFVADPHDLAIRLWVNGELMQDSSSRCMHFSIPELIEYLSEELTLQPGDVIATGTPAGVGRAKGRYLRPGDRIAVEIQDLGGLENVVIAHP
jgi:2-keto-4-pentenoate hydratase/2-oxohepta-3-ene-1,7-dioic acid hydratase in catechol pathway